MEIFQRRTIERGIAERQVGQACSDRHQPEEVVDPELPQPVERRSNHPRDLPIPSKMGRDVFQSR